VAVYPEWVRTAQAAALLRRVSHSGHKPDGRRRGDVSTAAEIGATVGSVALGSLAALHLGWAAGVTWPAANERALAEVVTGKRQMPGPGSCLTVTAALSAASGIVAGIGGRHPVAQAARAGLALGFFLRGATGITATTGRLVPWTPEPRFIHLDRHYYGPLCVGISLAVTTSIPGPH
jgi:Protein of unknown function (DUF3995)